MSSRGAVEPKGKIRLPACLILAGVVLAAGALWLAATHTIVHGAGNLEPALIPRAYLPVIARFVCPGDVIVNGNFEQGGVGWYQYATGGGIWWRPHDLIGTEAEGFNPYDGVYGATLGGYETSADVLTQTVTIPAGGQLSYWWQMHTFETEVFHDNLRVELLTLGGELLSALAYHNVQGPEGIWQQDVVDVSAHAGQTLVLRFQAYNDNYYFSWFNLDLVCLCPAW